MNNNKRITAGKAAAVGIVSGLLVILAAVLAVVLFKLAGTVKSVGGEEPKDIAAQPAAELSDQSAAEPIAEPTAEPVSETGGRGTWQPIPEQVVKEITGVSYPSDGSAVISLDELAYLTIPYRDFDGVTQMGEMIVARDLADEVLDIFAELYEIGYPIERMQLVDKYGGSDFASIEANNTSAFNYRMSTDSGTSLSKHALGRAIDINPQINPYVNSNGTGSHENAAEYWSRDVDTWSDETDKQAYIGPGTEIYRIFVNEHGWEWGGSWDSYRDYQHFQKIN